MYKKRLAMDTSNGFNDGEAGGEMNFSPIYANEIFAPKTLHSKQTIFSIFSSVLYKNFRFNRVNGNWSDIRSSWTGCGWEWWWVFVYAFICRIYLLKSCFIRRRSKEKQEDKEEEDQHHEDRPQKDQEAESFNFRCSRPRCRGRIWSKNN